MADEDASKNRSQAIEATLCPLCQSEIAPDAKFCAYCGKQLGKKGLGAARWFGYMFLILIAAAALAVYYLRAYRPAPADQVTVKESTDAGDAVTDNQRVRAEPESAIPETPAEKPFSLTVGSVSINAITGLELARIPAAVLAGGWIALPQRACLGGYDWQFRRNAAAPLTVEEGIVADEDSVGLWRLRADLRLTGPPLAAWRSDLPLTWTGLEDSGEPEPVEVTVIGQQPHFLVAALPGGFFEPGLFIQADRVVGWTFGDLADNGFLWIGDEGRNLVGEIRVDDYYRLRFADSREEEFLRAMAMTGDYSDLERLAAFAGAFRFESKPAPDALGGELQPAAISERIRTLIDRSVTAGLAADVAAIFDADILVRAADPALILDVVQATADGIGDGEAIALLENAMDQLTAGDPADREKLVQKQADLYRRWLSAAIQEQDFQTASRAFADGRRRFPADLAFHLLGVRLALAQNDWSEAERLLEMKSYPAELSAEVAGLRAQILDLKAQAGTIVIRFAPGSRQVPVAALLDGRVRQQFIVDTGASMVTIPSDTARELGLIINVRTPRRTIYTAGGAITAPEVLLSAVDIDGWEVTNVSALVVDLPDTIGWGLLGMNYLRRFRMDLNTEEGLLLLEPR